MQDDRFSPSPPAAASLAAITADAPPAHDRPAGLPPRVARLVERAQRWSDRREFAAAEQCMREAVAIAPANAEVLRLLAAALQGQGRQGEAIALLRRAAELQPGDPLIDNNLGSALGELGEFEAALQAFRRATDAAPGLAASWFNLGQAHDALMQTAAAEAAFSRALAIDASHAEARVLRAGTLRTMGRIDEAAGEFRSVLAARPGSVEAWAGLVGLESGQLDAEELRKLESLLQRAHGDARSRAMLGFACALALEAHGRYDEAFRVVCEANAAKRARSNWDAAAFSRIMRDIATAFSEPVSATDDASLGTGIIFLVGMPRSGSTLAEQILSSHPDVSGAGEIGDLAALIREESTRRGADFPAWIVDATPEDWTRLGRSYLQRIAHLRDGKQWLTDKALQNWQLVGVIRAMLPGARVIDCRRDPVETCWSCFKHDFGDNVPFTNDLDDLAAYWHDYDRLMRFWQERHPSFAWVQDYEALVADPERCISALLDHCGLAFDERCLRFHQVEREVRTMSAAQVRAPLRNDTARTHRYGRHLDPLRRALAHSGASAPE